MFAVKKMGKNGIWGTVSLIDKNGSFRGEARFETRKVAEQYMQESKKRMKKPVDVQVFDESEAEPAATAKSKPKK